MFVHVVKPEESLFSIAKLYGGTAEWIRTVNELEQDRLIPGMSLVIPAGPPSTLGTYTVQQDDTIEMVARKFRVPPRVIQAANERLHKEELQVGQTIWLPQPVTKQRMVEINAYMIPIGGNTDWEIVEDVADDLTYLSVFSCRVQPDATLVEIPDKQVLAASKAGHVAPLLTVTNFDGSNFNPDYARVILKDERVRRIVISNLVARAKEKGYYGINVDFEHVHPDLRDSYNRFIRELAEAAKARNLTISVTVGPKMADDPNSPWVGAFDYRTLGQYADHLTLLTFEWGWAGGQPMAIAPLNMVRQVLAYALTEVAPEKIMMGMALYGYNWAFPAEEGSRAVGISPKSAMDLAVRHQTHIHFPTESAAPMFTYGDSRSQMRQVWFEDARSVLAKFHLVQEMGLRGISYWMLGHPFPQNWALLRGTFQIQKRPAVGSYSTNF